MEIKNKILISVSEIDLIKGIFINNDVIEVADNCFMKMPSLKKIILLKVEKIGNYCFSSNQALTEVSVPALTTCGNYCFRSNQALTEVSVYKYKLIVQCIDNLLFVIESNHILQEIRIYSGYIFLSIKDKKIEKQNCFVAKKDKYFAHGETAKKAAADLQFKIIAEKLKK